MKSTELHRQRKGLITLLLLPLTTVILPSLSPSVSRCLRHSWSSSGTHFPDVPCFILIYGRGTRWSSSPFCCSQSLRCWTSDRGLRALWGVFASWLDVSRHQWHLSRLEASLLFQLSIWWPVGRTHRCLGYYSLHLAGFSAPVSGGIWPWTTFITVPVGLWAVQVLAGVLCVCYSALLW